MTKSRFREGGDPKSGSTYLLYKTPVNVDGPVENLRTRSPGGTPPPRLPSDVPDLPKVLYCRVNFRSPTPVDVDTSATTHRLNAHSLPPIGEPKPSSLLRLLSRNLGPVPTPVRSLSDEDEGLLTHFVSGIGVPVRHVRLRPDRGHGTSTKVRVLHDGDVGRVRQERQGGWGPEGECQGRTVLKVTR